LAEDGQSKEPKCRVGGISGLEQANSQPHRRQTGAAKRSWGDQTAIQVTTFDEEEWIPRDLAQSAQLYPQAPRDK